MAARGHLVNYDGDSDLKRWGRAIWARRGFFRAVIAMSRKLAVLMFSMWRSGKPFQPVAACG
jgi:transposase